jgi:hypothetical protein
MSEKNSKKWQKKENEIAMMCFLTDCVEGSGASYWAEARNIRRQKKPTEGESIPYVTSFQVRDGGKQNDRVSEVWMTVDKEAVAEAVAAILRGDLEVSRDTASQFVPANAPRNWNYDTDGVDVILQFLCFGELVYG